MVTTKAFKEIPLSSEIIIIDITIIKEPHSAGNSDLNCTIVYVYISSRTNIVLLSRYGSSTRYWFSHTENAPLYLGSESRVTLFQFHGKNSLLGIQLSRHVFNLATALYYRILLEVKLGTICRSSSLDQVHSVRYFLMTGN